MRYDAIYSLIDVFKPKIIAEIGTWNGHNAVRMIQAAQKHHSDIAYIGYDLFEDATDETDALEFNVKPHNTIDAVRATIEATGARVILHKGNTRQTLKDHPPIADFMFLDGGHSVETIASDYHYSKHIPVIVFDDFYDGREIDLNLVGCNKLVSSLSGCVVLPDADPVKGGGFTKLVLKI